MGAEAAAFESARLSPIDLSLSDFCFTVRTLHISGRLSTRIDSAPTQNQEMIKTKLSEYESNDDIKKLDNPDNMVSDKIGLKRFANT